MTTEQQITTRLQISKTDTDAFRAVVLNPEDLPVKLDGDQLSNPQFAQFGNGTVIEVSFRHAAGHLRLQGVIKVVSDVEVPEEHVDKNEWVLVDTEYFAPEEYALFETAMQVLADGETFRMMLAGSSGNGKTSRAKAWANAHGMEYVRINCAMIRDPEEWYVYREVVDGDTVTQLTPLSKALIAGNAVIVLDEINRLEPWLANSLFSLLDFDQSVEAHGVRITVGENVLFCMTKNQGHVYVGTFGMDAALSRRVDGQINVTAPPAAIERKILVDKKGITEDQAFHIIEMLNKLRNEIGTDEGANITTGPALKIAMLVKCGRSLREAFQYVVINPAPQELSKILLDAVNSRLKVL